MNIKKIFHKLQPPRSWIVVVTISVGILAGLMAYLFYISKAWSYLSDDSDTCVNCHIMAPQYATWVHSAHRSYTNCNSCHVPHDNVFNHYYFKAKDGLRHATIFTLRNEPQVIFIKEDGSEVVQDNCIRCHKHVITDYKLNARTELYDHSRSDRKCWECHRQTPHGRVNSLSSTPNARVPVPPSPVPGWLNDINIKK